MDDAEPQMISRAHGVDVLASTELPHLTKSCTFRTGFSGRATFPENGISPYLSAALCCPEDNHVACLTTGLGSFGYMTGS